MKGKPGTAPCGHSGFHVTPNYVTCSQGCDPTSDGVPDHVEVERTGQLCRLCGSDQVARWDEEFKDGERWLWSCRTCGKEFLA